MDLSEFLKRSRRVVLEPGELEANRTFRTTLTRLASNGLQGIGLLGIAALTILVLFNIFLLGRPIGWWYPAPLTAEDFVLWDKAVVGLLCAAAVVFGRVGTGLSARRSVGGVLACAVVAVSLAHDAFRGVLRVEYVIITYLLVVAAIPYRPWQALLLGGAVSGILAGLGHVGVPGTAAARPGLVDANLMVRMGFVTAVLTGLAALLYSARYHQHRARARAERLHERVARLERAKSQFFADVSRAFRTPLTLVLGTVQEALEGRLGELPSSLRNRLETVDGQTRRMRRLVNQLLELAQIDEGELSLSLRPQPLGALVRRTVTPFREWAAQENLSFNLAVEAGDLEVWVDADRFVSLLTNPLSNAIEYTPEDGTIRVRVFRRGEHAAITIRDSGPGLPESIRDRVLNRPESAVPAGSPTGRAASTPSGTEGWIGMGIGLAHTRALVERHGGRLEIESESGFGTELTVLLPLGAEHASASDRAGSPDEAPLPDPAVDVEAGGAVRVPSDSPTEASASAPSAGEEAPEVLVVDDESVMRNYLRALLGGRYRIRTAVHGEDGLAALRDRPPDLVISDVVMPERDGIELCRAIRADDQLRSLPVILLTARQDQKGRLSGLRAGADAYLPKPFDPAELVARVETLIEIRRVVQRRVRVPDWMKPTAEALGSEDAEFLERVNRVIDEHIDNSNFGVDWLADELDLSPRHLRRRLNEVTRLSPSGLIRARRLQHAAALLRQGADTVSDVAAAVGYRDASYFSRLFREAFGASPTEYADEQAE